MIADLPPGLILILGAVLVPLNYRLAASDHEYILNHAGVRAVLVDWEYTAVVDAIRPKLTAVPSDVRTAPRRMDI